MIVVRFECSKYSTTSFPVIDIIVVVVTTSYGCSTFTSEPELPVRFLLEFFSGLYPTSTPERILSEMRAVVLETRVVPVDFRASKNDRWNGLSQGVFFSLASTLILTSKCSESPDKNSMKHFSGQGMREKSTWFA